MLKLLNRLSELFGARRQAAHWPDAVTVRAVARCASPARRPEAVTGVRDTVTALIAVSRRQARSARFFACGPLPVGARAERVGEAPGR